MPADEAFRYERRFRALSSLAVEAAGGAAPDQLLERAVADAVGVAGLRAGAIRIFGEGDVDLINAMAGEEAGRARLSELERTLLADLRRNYAVKSLFMTLDLDGPSGLFSYPLRSGNAVIGSISGIAKGERNLAVEEEFVAGLAALVVLIGRRGESWAAQESPAKKAVSSRMEAKIKNAAVHETAAAVNHEINNPLMAVVGNLELLLRRSDQFDSDSLGKLEKVREAAERIRTVVQNLMRIRDARSIDYPGGSMLDIDGSPKRDG